MSEREEVESAIARCLAMYARMEGVRGADRIAMQRAIEEDPKVLSRDQQVRFIVAATGHPRLGPGMYGAQHGEDGVDWPAYHLASLCGDLLDKKLPMAARDAIDIIEWMLTGSKRATAHHPGIRRLVIQLDRWHQDLMGDDALRASLRRLAEGLERGQSDDRRLAAKIRKMLPGDLKLPMEAGEAWSDAAIAFLEPLDEPTRVVWIRLLRHCMDAESGKPTKKWSAVAEELIAELGEDLVLATLLAWFPLVDKPRTIPKGANEAWQAIYAQHIAEPHARTLKGLCWIAARRESAEMARVLSALAISCYRKLPGQGARVVKVGNAAVYALGAMPGEAALGQLARLRVKVKFGTAQRMIASALDRAAEREGLPRDEVEEMAVPAYGLEMGGVLREELGACTAEIRVGEKLAAALVWINEKGKTVKSPPAEVKREHADDVKELKTTLKDIQSMLPAQRDRIDGLFLERKRWALEVWRERYLDHPLVGTVARRLIWVFDDGKATTAAAWLRDDPDGPPHAEGKVVDASGAVFEPSAGSTVTLWHPIDSNAKANEDVLRPDIAAWRAFYEDNRIRQPFKQAHREVYVLTDAERQTATYSNRFATHAVSQYQFNALVRDRGWKHALRMAGDDGYEPPRRVLPAWGLRVEFWVSGLGDRRDPELIVGSGSWRFLATDQVRFYRAEQRIQDDNPIPLDQLPPIVLSECLRDVDLFVGVSSVGNNPEWADGGPGGRFQTYWGTYSFGELGVDAKTRRDILSRVIPRLAIAEACTISDRFLVVRGTKRTYKIHLGSGNILMEPNDQYLCIVQGRTANDRGVFLPFEGDRTLAIILSKAFMLAEDNTIKDRTILSQIER